MDEQQTETQPKEDYDDDNDRTSNTTMLQSLKDWMISHNGDGRGPTEKENPALAAWVREQRRQKADFDKTMQSKKNFQPSSCHGKTTLEQRHVDQLDEIGFDWRESDFDIMFRQLENFKLTHGKGSCHIPDDYEDTELVRWVQVQRDNKHRLDAIGFEWHDEENVNPNAPAQQVVKQQKKKNDEPLQQQAIQQHEHAQEHGLKKKSQKNAEEPSDLEEKRSLIPEKQGVDSESENDGDDGDASETTNKLRCLNDNNYEKVKSIVTGTAATKERQKERIHVDVGQFSHLKGYKRSNAIKSAIRAEKRRMKELKQKKQPSLFSNEVISVYLSDDSASGEDEEIPDVEFGRLLSDDGEEKEPAVHYTEEEILAFPVSAQIDWDVMFAKLIGFQNKHGHVNVPYDHPDQNLVSWCTDQRNRIRRNRMTRAELHRLESIGFVVNKKEYRWNQMFRLLVELQTKARRRITQTVLQNETHPDADKLRDWMRRQNKYRNDGTLSQERIEKLDKVGFEWKITTADKWEYMFEKLLEFKRVNGHCRVPLNFVLKKKGSGGTKKDRLGEWVRYQRKRRNYASLSIEKAQEKRLEDIGFDWVVDRRLAHFQRAAPY